MSFLPLEIYLAIIQLNVKFLRHTVLHNIFIAIYIISACDIKCRNIRSIMDI